MAEHRSRSVWCRAVVTKCTQLEVPPPQPESEFDAASAIDAGQNAAITAIVITANTDKLSNNPTSASSQSSKWRDISQAKDKQLWRILASFKIGCHWLKVHTDRGNRKRTAHMLT